VRLIKYQTQKAVAHAQRAPQLFGFGLFITSTYLHPETLFKENYSMAMQNSRRAAGGLIRDFHAFIMKGNVIDLAVAVIIGGAFGKIVASLIEDIITPVLLNPALQAAGVKDLAKLEFNGIKYGVFLASVINFLVIALVIFLTIRSFESMKRKKIREEAVVEIKPDPQERLTLAIERLAEVMESK